MHVIKFHSFLVEVQMNAGFVRATRVITPWRLGLQAPLVTRNKSLRNMSDLSKELLAVSSAGASLCCREAGERRKESDTQQEPVPWREREEDALIMTALINSDEDHESDHNIILHHGNSYDNDY